MPNPILMRKLHSSLNAAALAGGGGAEPTFTDGLVLWLESSDFDAVPHFNVAHTWSDKSGNANDFIASSVIYDPFVDQITTLNGHATIRYEAYTNIRHHVLKGVSSSFSGVTNFTAAEIVCIYKKDFDPPAANKQGSPFTFGGSRTFEDAWPFPPDSNVYASFCDSSRPLIGNPTVSMTTWHAVNVRDRKNGTAVDSTWYFGSQKIRDVTASGTWIDFNAAPYPLHTLGQAHSATLGNTLQGNIAAVFMWKKILSTEERGALNTHINAMWGITVPNT